MPHRVCLLVLFTCLIVCRSGQRSFGDASEAATDSVRLIRNVAYATYQKDRRLLADIYLPPRDGPFPTILMIHGGAWFAGNKVHVALHARHAAEHGYAVVAINYRLAPAHPFPAQLQDCRAALRWIQSDKHAYPFRIDHIATYGYSAGANLACLVGLSGSKDDKHPIRAIVAGGAPCEFSWIPAERDTLAYWLGGSKVEAPDLYEQASPTTYVSAGDPPVYLFHGEKDRVVPLRSPENMKSLLEERKVEVHLHVVPGAGHLATYVDPDARKRAIAFLDQKLKGRDVSTP